MRIRIVGVACCIAAALFASVPLAVADDTSAHPTDASPAADVLPPSLTIRSSANVVRYGSSVTLSGTLAPAAVGSLVLERSEGGSSWNAFASTSTDASGRWSLQFTPPRNVTIRARMVDESATSAELKLAVVPVFRVRRIPTAPAFAGAVLRARVWPPSYTGRVVFRVRYAGRIRAAVARRPRNGVLTVTLPTIGVGRLPVSVTLPAASGMRGTTSRTAVRATTRPLTAGSRGADVRGLTKRLRYLNYHTPGATTLFDARVGDVVLAFHKMQRMSRTRSVELSTWKRLATAAPLRPRHASRQLHLEVDKTRQVMMVARNGRILGAIHVSTGASGNTPVGTFHIYQMGGSHLYRFMAFIGNYGIHGYFPVPAYPASHGCVREPMWAAPWTYRLVDYGTPVIVYA